MQRHRIVLLALVSTCGLPAVLRAQSLPLISAEISGGQGGRSTHAGEVWYRVPARETYVRTGVAVRLGTPGRVRPVLSVDYSHDPPGDYVAVCGIAPNGTCEQLFPATSGVAAGLGVRALPLPRLTLGSSVGLARYTTTARFVEVEAAVGVVPHVHLLAHLRRLTWREAAGPRLWFQPLTFGVRVQ